MSLANTYPVVNGVRERATPEPQVLADAIDARESVYRVIVVKDLGDKVKVLTGTGFAIRARDDRCLVLTCDHVLRHKKGGEGFDRNKDSLFVRKMCYTGDLRVRDFPARLLYTDPMTDLAVIQANGLTEVMPLSLNQSAVVLGRTAIAVGYCNVPDYGYTRTPTVSPGIITSYPYLSTEGGRRREVVNISCVGVPGMSGCPVVSLGGVIGVAAVAITVVEDGKHYIQAVSTSVVHAVMKKWLNVPANDARTINQVIGMLEDLQ